MKRVSLKDVATRAGVSTALVSYILNDRHKERISKETAERVKEVARELNYRPNRIAQSLKSSKTNTIALLVADIANPFTSQIARFIEDETGQKGYTMFIGSSDEKEDKLRQLTELFQNRQVDGFIIAPVEGSEEIIREMEQMNIPLVLIDRYFRNLEVPVVTTNNYGISYQAVDYLINKGYKRIGIVAYKTELIHLNERVNGYKRAVSDKGLSEVIKYIDESHIQEETDNMIEEFVEGENKVDAVFFTTNRLALAGLKKLMKMKVQIPEDLALLAFDESDSLEVFRAPVTYIRQPLQEISREAVNILTQLIESPGLKYKPRIYNSKLIVQQST